MPRVRADDTQVRFNMFSVFGKVVGLDSNADFSDADSSTHERAGLVNPKSRLQVTVKKYFLPLPAICS